MSAAAIARALGDARREGREWRCRCPLHGGRSLCLRDSDGGHVLAYCHGGCDSRAVYAELRRRGFLAERVEEHVAASGLLTMSQAVELDARLRRQAIAIWREAVPAAGTPVEEYLRGRGIEMVMPDTLRFHPECPHPIGARLPAMIGLVEHLRHGVIGIHRTFLRPDGRGKAPVTPDKASMGAVGGGAVRLSPPSADQWHCVGEGIETVASVASACDLSAWAALSANGLRKVELSQEARKVQVCVDHDANGVGQRAAYVAAHRFSAEEGRRVRIALPPPGADFNDVLTGRARLVIDEVPHVT